MQFLKFIEAIAGIITPSNITDVINLVEKLIVIGEQAAAAIEASQQQK